MKQYKTLLLLVAAAILVAGAVYLQKSGREAYVRGKSAPLLSEIDDTSNLNSISKLAISSGNSTLQFARVDGKWIAKSKYDYPLDSKQLKQFLLDLSQVESGEKVAINSTMKKDLKLLKPRESESANAVGQHVVAKDDAGNQVFSLIVGKSRTPSTSTGRGFSGYAAGRYILYDDTAWLIAETLSNLPQSETSWMEKNLLNMSSDKIKSISIEKGDTTLDFRRNKEGDLVLADIETGKEKMKSSKVNQIAKVLNNLSFKDVASPKLSQEETGLDSPLIYTALTKGGAEYTLLLGKESEGGNGRYGRVEFAYRPSEKGKTDSNESEDQDQKAKASKAAGKSKAEELKAELESKTERFSDWVYILPNYKVDSISAKRGDYVEKPEAEKEQQNSENGKDKSHETTS